MSTSLSSVTTVTAMALAAMLAAGCASQSPADRDSANTSTAAQPEVVSQTTPDATTDAALPSTQTAQYGDSTTADGTRAGTPTAAMVDNSSPQAAPATPMQNDANRWASANDTTLRTGDGSGYASERSLPPRADRN